MSRLIFYSLLLPLWCAAVQPYTPKLHDPVAEPWRWRYEDSLSDLGVLCMDEAEDGTLWFGNVGSVASYDGKTVTKIPFDEELLSGNNQQTSPRALALLVLKDDSLLVLIENTLALRKDGEWRVILRDLGQPAFVSKLIQSDDGTIWVMVPGALWRIEKDFSKITNVATVSGSRALKSFCIGQSGDLWLVEKVTWDLVQLVQISLENGVQKEDARQRFDVPFKYDRGEFSLVSRSNGTLALSATQYGLGLHLFDPQSGQWEIKEADEFDLAYRSLMEGSDQSVWIGLQGGISRLTRDEELLTYSGLDFELPPVHLSLFEDSNKRLWVIGRIGQVLSLDLSSEEWLTYVGLNFEFETEDGVQWFRSKQIQHAISHDVHSGKWTQYGPEDGLVERTRLLFLSSHGLVWAAGRHEGRAAISVFDGKQWVRQVYPQFSELILPDSLFEANDGTVWVGAQGRPLEDIPNAGGALQFRVKKDRSVELLKHHSPPDLPYYVTAFEQTPDDTIWVGSTLVRSIDKNSVVQNFPELQGENVVAMALDHQQNVWLAKEHFGVCRWTDGSWNVFAKEDGLPDLKLTDLAVLPDGSLLVASAQAISRFDGSSWSSDTYPEWFGMSSRWSNLKSSSDGSVWLNYVTGDKRMSSVVLATRGCCAIRRRTETAPPDTQIDDCLKRVSQPGNTHITWSAYDLWSSTPREALQYSWRMDDGEWSVFSRDTGRTFLKLSSGKHILEVRARDRAFNMDPTPARVEFSVTAPLWRQAWFIVMLSGFTGLILVLTWLLIRSRERHLMEQQAEREKNMMERQTEREKNMVERQTEREKNMVERQQEREEHLLEMDRMKTGFFTNISHELRTPMTVISGRIETVLNSDLGEQNKKALQIVLRNARRVSTLVTQLLDFRKIEEGKIKVEITQGDLVPFLREWVASMQVLAEEKQIACTIESVDECYGSFDFDKVQKIFTNLISNAVKYTNAGGEIRIALQIEEGGRIRFIVEDNGMGISQEHLKHVFDRFYRVSEESLAVGAGIGLNLTKELVDLLGGEIRADSPIHPDPERPGTRFTVLLPVCDDISEGGVEEDARTHDDLPSEQRGEIISQSEIMTDGKGSQLKKEEPQGGEIGEPLSSLGLSGQKSSDQEFPLILTVEDDEDIREFIVEGLSSKYRVEMAENGAVGLQKAKELVPDLVITDVMMPVMDGVQMCREIKTSMETSHIPVVMLTAKTALESQVEGLKTGADDYITKPFHMELLQVRIENLLESRRLLRETFRRENLVLTSSLPENTPERAFVEKARLVLDEHYSEWEFGLDEFSTELKMSRRTLQRKFNAVLGRTATDFINDFRMMKAAKMLAETSDTVAEIMYQTGYDEPSNFSRLFKKYYKMSPSQYRASLRSS